MQSCRRDLLHYMAEQMSVFKNDQNTYYPYYFHVNGSIGVVQKIDFEIRPDLGCTTPKTSRKVVLDNPSVCLSVCFIYTPKTGKNSLKQVFC